MISQKTIDEIRDRASLLDIIGKQVSIKRAGRNYVGLCPFHSEKSPSFHIRDDEKSYHCFGCGASGNVFTFIMESKGLSFPEAALDIATSLGIAVEYTNSGAVKTTDTNKLNQLYTANQLATNYFVDNLKKAPQQVIQYLQSRKITKEAISEFAIGYVPEAWDGLIHYLKSKGINEELIAASGLARRNSQGKLYDVFRARIIFPIQVDKSRTLAFGGRVVPGMTESEAKYINSPETDIYKKSKTFYGLLQSLQYIRQLQHVYLVEGYMDVIGLWQAGVKNVLATCGTAITDQHIKKLTSLANSVTLVFDGDAAGKAAAAKSFPIFLNSGLDVSVLFLPEGDDPDTFALKYLENTKIELEKLPRSSLFESYLEAQIAAHKGQSLGAALKGKLVDQVIDLVIKVENTIERSILIERLASRLLIPVNEIQNRLSQSNQESKFEPRSLNNKNNQEEKKLQNNKATSAKLSKLEEELLTCVFAHKDELCQSTLRNPIVCSILSDSALRFLSELQSIIEVSQGSIGKSKELITELFKSFGPEWKALWLKAFKMKDKADLLQSYKDCLKSIERNRLKDSIKSLDIEIINCQGSDLELKLRLSQEKLDLLKKIQSMNTSNQN